MTTALVIGGNRGFGKALSDQLGNHGFDLYTIGRSEECSFQCDISDVLALDNTLRIIKNKLPVIDVLACVVGYARAKSSVDLTENDWRVTLQCNLGYITQSLEVLNGNILKSENNKVITIGSRWSLRRDCPLLLPYIEAKHQLRSFVESKHGNPKMSCYCVPPMETPGCNAVINSFQELGISEFPSGKFGDVNTIAKSIVDHNLTNQSSGRTYRLSSRGRINLI